MAIEVHDGGGMTITGKGDLPNGGISFYVLIMAYQAAKMHVKFNGRMRLTRNATPSNLVARLNQEYPDRPDGPFKARTMKALLPQIEAEVQRQHDLYKASLPEEQLIGLKRILNQM